MRRVAIAGCIAALAIGLSGCSGGGGEAAGSAEFVPNLQNAEFGDGWTDETTNQAVTPPQRIRITGSLDLTETAESIGYGVKERRLPRTSADAITDSSFPPSGNRIDMVTGRDDVLHLSWVCEWVPDHPDAENCKHYNVSFDVSGSEPEMLAASNSYDLPEERSGSTTLTEPSAGPGFTGPGRPRFVVTDARGWRIGSWCVAWCPPELPASVVDTDKATGATTAALRVVTQPKKTSANVYFVVNDSLTLYFGELEPSR